MLVVRSIIVMLAVRHAQGYSSSSTCPTYDPKKIKMVTFDCFACLMQWEVSMKRNVAEILPFLSESDVNYLVQKWENSYGANAGRVFDEAETGMDSFSWSISLSLRDILEDMGISDIVSRDVFHQLVSSWGNLIPWDETKETLKVIADANFTIGVLSNGDYSTLKKATQIFMPDVPFQYIFPSDFPVGAFKPNSAMYNQALQVGYDVSEILHVAGGGTDADGARSAGFFSAFNNVAAYNSHRLSFVHDVGLKMNSRNLASGDTTCFILHNITELPSILGINPLM